jgi:hypothetical protein
VHETLLVPRNAARMDEILDALDHDGITVALGAPQAEVWNAATLVLLDSERLDVLGRMPAHPRVVALVDATADSSRITKDFARAIDAGASEVAPWPHATETVATMVTEAANSTQPAVRIGIVGGHGGAGATTLAVALGLQAWTAGRSTLVVDADPLGGGVRTRLGRGERPAGAGTLTLATWDRPERQMPVRKVADAVEHTSAMVTVADLSRTLDPTQMAGARHCDLVYVVADARRNRHATDRLLDALSVTLPGTAAEVAMRLVSRRDDNLAARDLAERHHIEYAGAMPDDEDAVTWNARVNLTDGPLARFARRLLSRAWRDAGAGR